MDDHLIRYTAIISKMLQLKRIIFVHIAKDLQLPKELLEEFPDLLAPLDESIETGISAKVEQYFSPSEIDIQFVVNEGHPIEQILKLSKIKNADLIIMGRKSNLEGSGLVSSKIARKCPCSLLLVTANSSSTIKKLLVPIDYSNHSALAVNVAVGIRKTTQSDLHAIHIYGVPAGYHKTGKSFDEFAAIMKSHSEKGYKNFLKEYGLPTDISCENILTDNGKYPELTYDYAEKNDIDLIVIGSRGRTGISSILMGSVAEKLVYLDSHIPVLIVKEKGENMGFLDALMKI
jgi:nucleotide-binding universal stress UspA family protein